MKVCVTVLYAKMGSETAIITQKGLETAWPSSAIAPTSRAAQYILQSINAAETACQFRTLALDKGDPALESAIITHGCNARQCDQRPVAGFVKDCVIHC